MTFQKPVHVGNLVSCYVSVVKIGTTSITMDVEVWVEKLTTLSSEIEKVTEGRFIFVAVDEHGNPREVPQ